MRSLVSARWVLGHAGGSHRLLDQGQVVFDDDRIVYVGRCYPGPRGQLDEVVDLGESVLLPGLIDLDALTDIDHLLLDSWHDASGAEALLWPEEYAGRAQDVFTLAERLELREYALTQLALHGITTYMPIASEIHSRVSG